MKFDDLDPVLAAPARVAILATLADGNWWLFSDMRAETRLADGNLHVQTRKLMEAGYIRGEKVTVGGRRVTRFRLAETGRQALTDHVRRLERALKQEEATGTQGSVKAAVSRDDGGRVW